MSTVQKCLILSDGPVPTPEHAKVEGGGLRCWGLAQGIKSNDVNIEITIAYNQSYKIEEGFTNRFEGIQVATWNLEDIGDYIRDFDTVIVSYCMGDLSVKVADTIATDQQLILDCYVPIYVEVSARGSTRVEEEYRAFETDVKKWDRVLKRGDVFLCANEAQKSFYKGVLAAVGRINPVTYADDLLLVVPYGVYRDEPKANEKPIEKLIDSNQQYLKILWFGGIYPWFDIRKLADAVKEINQTVPAKLIVVGAKNPFNKHPDFTARYDEFHDYATADDMKQYVVMQEWINFNDRADWYLDADIVVVFNKEGEENKLAWRTRLVDFMWADLPVLTNAGDPLGELMIDHKAAIRMLSTEPSSIANTIIKVLGKDATKVRELKANMKQLKASFYWDVVTKDLVQAIERNTRAQDLEKMGVFSSGTDAIGRSGLPIRKVIGKAKKVPAYANKYGYKATALVMTEMLRRKLTSSKVLSGRKNPSYVFVSHQLDISGAPSIAIDMALEFKRLGKRVEFYTYLPAHSENLLKLNKVGIKPHVLMNKDMVPSFIAGDTLVLNTVAHSEVAKEAVFTAAEADIIKIIWYLHEDDPGLLFRPDEQRRIKKLLGTDRLKILIAAKKMRDNYVKYFETEYNIVLQPYRHVVPVKYQRILKSVDFEQKLTFILPGTMGDGRKGQLPIFYAFVQFYEHYYKPSPEKYRDFELLFVGVSDDFLSRQIIAHAGALKGHFAYHGKVTWLEYLDIGAKANFTICYSVREALPLFVFEGMAAGHPLLRNDASGMDEQLFVGKNGFYLESNDYDQVVAVLEKVLNRQETSSAELATMSAYSNKIALQQAKNSYADVIRLLP